MYDKHFKLYCRLEWFLKVSVACFQLRNGFLTKTPSGWEFVPALLFANATQNLQNAPSNFQEYLR